MNRRVLLAGMASAIPASAMAGATPTAQPDAARLLSDYLYLVVNQGDLSAIDTLFDRQAVDVEAVRQFHAAEIERLTKIGQRPSSLLHVTCAEGVYAMAYGSRSGANVYYVLKASAGMIVELSIATVGEAVMF